MGGHVQVSLHKLISKPLKHRSTGNKCDSRTQLKQPSLLDRLAQPENECQQSAVQSAHQHQPKTSISSQQSQQPLKHEDGSNLGHTSDLPCNRTSLCPVCGLQFPADDLQAHIALELSLLTESNDDCAAPVSGRSSQTHLVQPPKLSVTGSPACKQRPSIGRSARTRHQHPAGQQKVMILGSSSSTSKGHAGAVNRARKRHVQAFDHYSSGAGTWDSDMVGVEGAPDPESTWEGYGTISLGR